MFRPELADDPLPSNVSIWPHAAGLGIAVNEAVGAGAGLTACDSADDVLVMNVVSPPYTAVIECEPRLDEDVTSVATPPLRAPVPSVVAPSLKSTVPLGVPPEPVTVAVNVTDCANVEGLGELLSVVVVLVPLTVCDCGDEVLVVKFVSPL